MLKIIGLGVGAVVAVLLIAVVAILLVVDPNDYRDDITSIVKDATGRELTIKGDLSLSLFPWLGVSLGETSLANAPGFAEKNFAQVAAVNISVKLLPLLQQRIEMKTLELRGLQVSLSRTSDGRTNWDDLMAAPAAKAEQQAPSSKEVAKAGPAPLAALAIGGVNIEDAELRWDDQQTGQRIKVSKFSLRTGPIAPRTPIDIRLQTQLGVSSPALQTPIELQAQLTFDLQAQHYRIDALLLSLNVQSDVLPVSPLNVRLTGNIDADLAQQEVGISDLQLQALGLNAKVNANLRQILTKPQAEGKLNVANFSPRELLNALAIELPNTADAKVLNKATFNANFSGSTDAASMKDIEIALDDSSLSGALSVKNFAKPALHFDLDLDDIDVDRYLPPAAEAKTPPPSPAGAVVASAQLPLDMLRALNVTGDLRVGKLKMANARLSQIVLGLAAKDGQIQLNPIQAELYQGQYKGHVSLDVRKDTPKISADEKLSAVQVGPLLKDVLGDDKVAGVADLAAKVTASGLAPEAITKSLNGTANFRFSDGAVKGVNLGQMIREAYAKIKKQPAPVKASNQTDFAEMSGSVTIQDGVVHNQDLQAKSPVLRIEGKGTVDLPKQRIDYLINASIVKSDEGQGGKELEELKALTIPVKVTGSFDKPKFSLDLAPVLKTKVKAKLEQEKTKLKNQAEQKLDDKKAKLKKKLKDKLKGLF